MEYRGEAFGQGRWALVYVAYPFYNRFTCFYFGLRDCLAVYHLIAMPPYFGVAFKDIFCEISRPMLSRLWGMMTVIIGP
jgi:hypothetical protein